MPRDQNLYGQPPPKRRKNNMALSSSLDFSIQLTSLMSNSLTATSAPVCPRPSHDKPDIFAGTKCNPRNDTSQVASSSAGHSKLNLRKPLATEEASDMAHARRKMEEKARLYTAMKRGDYVAKDNEMAPLIDFDRKWAETEADVGKEGHSDSSSCESNGEDVENENNRDTEEIEFEDEFGRLRRGTRADKERIERQRRRGLLGAEELERMSARPTAPARLLYGDAIQTMAFTPDDPEKMAELARKRDRSATPPDLKHYDADSEIRTKGAGFYKFSKNEETRTKEFQSLEEERLRTEAARKERGESIQTRRRDIEQRRKNIEARRASKMADHFLEGLASDMEAPRPLK
ncbi:hypothetical protein CMUS01_06876 [Colletotrichum musicola]|uniref:Coiled-coil domain-containing protein 174 n=1 Tax=Colletotrichum musicola TaxID=2175873 RepID=A0A8H6KK74_9PEZI|nr:hypothetical protein CMUS01_06876 [Colletotrichum musicola]